MSQSTPATFPASVAARDVSSRGAEQPQSTLKGDRPWSRHPLHFTPRSLAAVSSIPPFSTWGRASSQPKMVQRKLTRRRRQLAETTFSLSTSSSAVAQPTTSLSGSSSSPPGPGLTGAAADEENSSSSGIETPASGSSTLSMDMSSLASSSASFALSSQISQTSISSSATALPTSAPSTPPPPLTSVPQSTSTGGPLTQTTFAPVSTVPVDPSGTPTLTTSSLQTSSYTTPLTSNSLSSTLVTPATTTLSLSLTQTPPISSITSIMSSFDQSSFSLSSTLSSTLSESTLSSSSSGDSSVPSSVDSESSSSSLSPSSSSSPSESSSVLSSTPSSTLSSTLNPPSSTLDPPSLSTISSSSSISSTIFSLPATFSSTTHMLTSSRPSPRTTITFISPSESADEPTPSSTWEFTTFTSAAYTTKYWPSTLQGSTVTESGVLNTDVPNANGGFAQNTGAIIGVSLAGTFFLISAVVFIFFACRRYKARRSHNDSRQALNFSPAGSWRPPLEGDDDEYEDQYYRAVGGRSGSGGGGAEQYGDLIAALQQHHHSHQHQHQHDFGSREDGMSTGHQSATVGQGSAESDGSGRLGGASHMPQPQSRSSFGQQPYMPGFGQALAEGGGDGRATSPALSRLPSSTVVSHAGGIPRRPSSSSGGLDPGRVGGDSGHGGTLDPVAGASSSHEHQSTQGNRSAGSLDAYASVSSSTGHGAASSSSRDGLVIGSRKRSYHGDEREMSGSRQTQTPPTSFAFRTSVKGKEREVDQELSDTSSFRGFLGRLRSGRTSAVSSSGGAVAQEMVGQSQDSVVLRPLSYSAQSPSSLLHPVPPSLHVQTEMHNDFLGHASPVENYRSSKAGERQSGLLWPAVTLPRGPSPVPTDNDSITLDGLLNPRLGAGMAMTAASSSSSLRDHVDYSRPIGGLVHNRVYSTTTFNTQDTQDATEGMDVS